MSWKALGHLKDKKATFAEIGPHVFARQLFLGKFPGNMKCQTLIVFPFVHGRDVDDQKCCAMKKEFNYSYISLNVLVASWICSNFRTGY